MHPCVTSTNGQHGGLSGLRPDLRRLLPWALPLATPAWRACTLKAARSVRQRPNPGCSREVIVSAAQRRSAGNMQQGTTLKVNLYGTLFPMHFEIFLQAR